MTMSSPGNPFAWSWPWPFGLAPETLNQPILPGWSLVSITENNSSAPDTERRIVAQDSYGRQIGRIMDVVSELVADRPKTQAIEDFDDLRDRVAAAKRTAAADRLTRIRDDLALLKLEDPAAYEVQVAGLRALLAEQEVAP